MKGHPFPPLSSRSLCSRVGSRMEGRPSPSPSWGGKLPSYFLLCPGWCWKETPKWGPPGPVTSSTQGTRAPASSLLPGKVHSRTRGPSNTVNSSSWGEPPCTPIHSPQSNPTPTPKGPQLSRQLNRLPHWSSPSWLPHKFNRDSSLGSVALSGTLGFPAQLHSGVCPAPPCCPLAKTDNGHSRGWSAGRKE